MKYALIFALFLFGCTSRLPDPATPMPPVITDTDKCHDACKNLRSLKCEEGDPIPTQKACRDETSCSSGQVCSVGVCTASCETFCEDTQTQGVWLDPVCISHITSCSQVDTCPSQIGK